MREESRVAVETVLILGCERSGSTWLSNILDSHPHVEFIMEPFVPRASLFPGFPGRNTYLANASDEIVRLIKNGYENIHDRKFS
jgi:hypothetical protein